MKTIFKFAFCIIIFALLSCEKDDSSKSHLDSITSSKYYAYEIIPTDYHAIYGKWKLFNVSGGFAGTGYEPDYDYLEIKSIGIYGLIKNGCLFEYGKIELDTFDFKTKQYLQIKLIPNYYNGLNPMMHPQERYVEIKRGDTLNLISPCCDMYDFHFIEIK